MWSYAHLGKAGDSNNISFSAFAAENFARCEKLNHHTNLHNTCSLRARPKLSTVPISLMTI